MDSLFIHIVASAAIDSSLAILCGILLARWWLGGTGVALFSARIPALVLSVGGVLQVFALAASFTGKSSVAELCRALPDILATHPGAVLGLSLGASLLLLVLAHTPWPQLQAAALVLCLLFRSGTGHAATEHVFSLPQAMQFVHLAAMSVWSGTVMIGGLVVLPRLLASEEFGGFLASLSRAATWALAGVLVSGGYRGYTGLEGDFHALLHTAWGLTLTAKLVAVAGALLLGGLNRLAIRQRSGWAAVNRLRTMRVLRAEAWVMMAILGLSATLANLMPPGD